MTDPDPLTLRFAGWDARRCGADEVTLAPEVVAEVASHLELPFPRDLGAFRGPLLTHNPANPTNGRWALVVLDPDAALVADALAPLIEQRVRQGVAFTAQARDAPPGVIRIKRPAKDKPEIWYDRVCDALRGSPPPYYLVFVGGPDRIPFEVQYVFDRDRATGRIDLGSAPSSADGRPGELDRAALRCYADKVVRFERGELPVERRALLYSVATDAPTAESHQRLIGPLAQHLVGDDFPRAPGAAPTPPLTLFRDDATTAALCSQLRTSRPALVITASHGIEFPSDPALWGALTDASFVGARGGPPMSAASVVPDQPFAPGAVVFSFACFSAGVPTRSAHAFLHAGREAQIVDRPMTAALPRALLAHPEGPIAFIGHVDRATSGAFNPRRCGPTAFIDFLNWTLAGDAGADRALATLGSAMETFRSDAAFAAQTILSTFTLGSRAQPQELVSAWIRYYDAVGYLLLGDPAVNPSDVLAKTAPPA